jgi:hypothetical protein
VRPARGYALDSVRDVSPGFLSRMKGAGLRQAGAVYLLGFLALVAAAPHRHLNSLEDLLSGGPSDSGIILERTSASDPSGGPHWCVARFTDDDPCLACFHNDWAIEPIGLLVFSPGFRPLCLARSPAESAVLPSLVRSGRSRSPPASA